MRALCFILAATFISSSFAGEELYGENLLLKMPFPTGEWETYRAKDGSGTVWVENNEVERVKVTVLKHSSLTPNDFKEYDAKLGSDNCGAFDSNVISDKKANGYVAILWETACTHKDNSVSKALYKVVKGKDAFYLVKKIWLSVYTKKNFDIWLNHLDKVSVCDTRSSEHPCPPLEKLR